MTKDTISKEWVVKNGYKLKVAYRYATIHKLNIMSKTDVLEILKVTDPDNENEEYADIFSKMLQLFDLKFKNTVKEK